MFTFTCRLVLRCFRAVCFLSDTAERRALPLTEETAPKLQRMLKFSSQMNDQGVSEATLITLQETAFTLFLSLKL